MEAFEVIANEFETTQYHVLACYQLYRAYLAKEQEGYQNPFCGTCNSRYWGEQVVSLYPDSEYALLVQNPDYMSVEAIKKAEEAEAYKEVLALYRERSFAEVITRSTLVIDKDKENHLVAKYHMLKALSIGELDKYSGQRDNYIAELEEIVRLYPGTEEEAKSADMLRILRGGLESGPEEKEEEEPEEELVDSPFEEDDAGDHFFAVVFNKERANFNEIKNKVSDFNSEYYGSLNLKVTSNLIDRERQIVISKTFNGKAEAMEYYNTFIADDAGLADINNSGFDRFVITKRNYVTLFKEKNLEVYLQFFEQVYKD